MNSATRRSSLILLFVFFYIFLFSNNALWLGDDITYGFIFSNVQPTISGEHITSFCDVIHSQRNHYFVENGRVVAHFIVQLIIPFMNKTIFAILNGLAYCLFIYLVVSMGFMLRNCTKSPSSSPLIHWKAVGYVSLMTIFAISLKYVPTTAMYIWMYDLVLTFLYILLNCPSSPRWALLLLPFSLIVGNAHESINIGLAFGLFLFGLRKIKRLLFNEYIMLIGFALGLLFLALSPASQSRAANSDASIIKILLSIIYLRASLVFGLVLLSALRNKTLMLKDLWQDYGCFLLAIIVQVAFCFAIKNTGPRPQYGAEVLSMICTISLWNKARIGKRSVLLAFLFLLIMVGWKTIRDAEELKSDLTIYSEVRTKFMNSKTGAVTKEFPSGKSPMSRVFSYIFGRANDAVYSYDQGSHDYAIMNLQKQFNYELKSNKKLQFITPLSTEIYKYPDTNIIIETQPGNFHAIISKTHPAKRVIVYRSAVNGLLPWTCYTLFPNAEEPEYETQKLKVYTAYDQMYFVGIDSVVIIE